MSTNTVTPRRFGYDCYKDPNKPWMPWWEGYNSWEAFLADKFVTAQPLPKQRGGLVVKPRVQTLRSYRPQ